MESRGISPILHFTTAPTVRADVLRAKLAVFVTDLLATQALMFSLQERGITLPIEGWRSGSMTAGVMPIIP
jgi:hypothetical protein